jgi:hypothetical protein
MHILRRALLSSRPVVLSIAAAVFAGVPGLLCVGILISAPTYPSFAVPITYTEKAIGSGSLGGVPFTNADVVLTTNGDTVNIGPSGPGANFGPTTVGVSGGIPASFVNTAGVLASALLGPRPGQVPWVSFYEQRPEGAGFLGSPILGTYSAAFATYQLATSIGPISGATRFFSGGMSFPTTNGDFILTSVAATSTFTATAVGDPHFTTYDGIHYDYQGIGDFLLTRSTIDEFDVQVRTWPLNDGAPVTIMSEAAVMVCEHNVTFDIDRASAGGSFVWLDGAPTSLSIASPVLTLGTCKIDELSPEHYQVVWNTGEMLDVTNNETYLDLSSQLSWIDGLGSMEGLLSSDLTPDVWRVTDGTSLFDLAPEPTTFSLLTVGIGLTGLAILRRRPIFPKPH